MSRSNPSLTNPAQHFLQWSGSRGDLTWWNKDKQENVQVKIPFEFIVLDELATISGYSDQDTSGFWSNEVRNITRDELNVRTKRGTKHIGLYKDIKGGAATTGAKYAKSIYLVHKIGDEWVMGNLKASGAALTAWIELGNHHVIQSGKITLTGSEEASKGATKYHIPTFEWNSTTDEEEAIAVEKDRELQVYLNQYLAQSVVTAEQDAEINGEPTVVMDDTVEPLQHNRSAGQSGYDKAKAKAAEIKAKSADEERIAISKDDSQDISNLLEQQRYEDSEIDLNDIPF